MRKSLIMMGVVALVATVAVLMPEMAIADAGDSLAQDLVGALRGNYGTLLGLAIAVFGLWQWLMNQNTWGVVMIIGGAALTAFPSIFDNIRGGVTAAFTGVSDTAKVKAAELGN